MVCDALEVVAMSKLFLSGMLHNMGYNTQSNGHGKSKLLGLKYSKIAVQLSHLPVPQADRIFGAVARLKSWGFPASKSPQ